MKIDNQLITLTIPSLETCTTDSSALDLTLTSTAIRRSHAPKLRFKSSAFYIGKVDRRDHQRTVRRLPAKLALRLSHHLGSALYTLEVVTSYRKHGHKKSKAVTKTLKAKFRVC